MTDKKPKKREKDDPEQSRRFVETAEELKTDKGGKKFKEAINSISKKKEK